MRHFKIFFLLLLMAGGLGVVLEFLNIADPYPAEALYILGIAGLIPATILVLVKDSPFLSWLRFTAWWIPVSIFLIIVTPQSSGQWMPIYFVGKEEITWLMGGLFLIISLVLIGWKLPKRKSY